MEKLVLENKYKIVVPLFGAAYAVHYFKCSIFHIFNKGVKIC